MSKLTLVLIVCVLCVIGVSLRAVAASVDAALLQQTPTLTITATPMSLCPTATPVQGASVFSSTPGAREPATASPQTNCVAPTATPYWIAQPTSAPADTAYTADTTLEALGVGDITLADPVGSSQFRFTIPEDWVMRGTNQLTLNLQYFQDKPDASGSQAGNLLIALDNTPLLLANVQANTAEAQQLTITLPNDALNDPERRTHSLRISLDTLENCRNNITARLFMDTALSGFRFEYQQYPPLLDLAKYPRPFYNNDLVAIPEVLMVMPDKAAATDWEAAASLAGGLGRMTGDNITTRVVNAGELTTPELRDHNMILIGKPADNALTAALFDAQILPCGSTIPTA